MDFKLRAEAVACGWGLFLVVLGAAILAAWQHGFWAIFVGAVLAAMWLIALERHKLHLLRTSILRPEPPSQSAENIPLPILLDRLPVPLLSVELDAVRTLNGLARALFATDDRVLPKLQALTDSPSPFLMHEGRRYRINRIQAGARVIVALVDIEAEERTAEARATADMIQVLGHELLNGLAPIVSLAESGLAANAMPRRDETLLAEILGTLARRAEGLLRFTEAYRTMARLPDPIRSPVGLVALSGDLARLFNGRWDSKVRLETRIEADVKVSVDRDQITQATWALLQNGAEAAIRADSSPLVELAMSHVTGHLVIEVTDTGTGVQAADIGRIFRPFQTTKPQGTGIGLSLTRQIAHAHGGEVGFVAAKRTMFRIKIPCDRGFESDL